MSLDSPNQVKSPSNEFITDLRNETRQLLDIFLNEYDAKNLSDMLHGAWITLGAPNNNPDYLPQVAHSIRELVEKAHDYVVEVPVRIEGNGLKSVIISLAEKWSTATQNTKSINITEWSGTVDGPFQKILKTMSEFFATFSAEHKPRSAQHKATLATLDGSGQPVPEAIMKERLKVWGELDDFFKAVAHHKKTTTKKVLESKIIALEDFILDVKYPERSVPIDTLDILDSIIAEGETV